MYGYVYLITNKINGKKYVGMRSSAVFDEQYWGSGKQILQAIAKYGKENFTREILHWCETPEQLVEYEIRELVERNADKSSEYYNMMVTKTPIMIGDQNPFFGKHHTEQTKKIISDKNKGREISPAELEIRKNFWKSDNGIKLIEKMKQDRTNVNLSQDHRDKIIQTTNSVEYKQLISSIKKEYYESDKGHQLRKHLSKMASNRFKGVPKSQEQKEKMSQSAKGKKKPHMAEINRNLEKIRKTADKNRGSKRSEESKRLMSEKAKGRIPANKGGYYVHNPSTGDKKLLNKNQEIPEGYVKGYGSRKHKI